MQTIITGLQSTGNIHIGNYIGAVNNALNISKGNKSFFFIADLHAITVDWEPDKLSTFVREVVTIYLAAGFDLETCNFFLQSQNYDHTYLAWLLNGITPFGWLNKMIQFKEKSQKYGKENIKAGLLQYPVLMAADILLYDADIVPVGEDQTQHVELTRNIAEKFNSMFGETFKLPKAVVPKIGGRIKSLQNPTKKMSKTDEDLNGKIHLFESPDTAAIKIKKAVTDSDNSIRYDIEKKPAISNLLEIYASLTQQSINELENTYIGIGYGQFKTDLAEIVRNFLINYQQRYESIYENPEYINNVLKKGLNAAHKVSEEKLKEVKTKMGFRY